MEGIGDLMPFDDKDVLFRKKKYPKALPPGPHGQNGLSSWVILSDRPTLATRGATCVFFLKLVSMATWTSYTHILNPQVTSCYK